jgi:hypothetical protein
MNNKKLGDSALVRYKFILNLYIFMIKNFSMMKERIHKRLPVEFVKKVLVAFNRHNISEREAMNLLGGCVTPHY